MSSDDTDDPLLRLRAALADQFVPVVALLLVLAAVGGWVTYGAYAEPGTTTERETVTVWTAQGSFAHGATVTESNPLYDTGTRLSNRSVYYPAIAPTLNGSFRYGYRARADGSLDGRLRVVLLTRSVSSVEGEGGTREVVNWRRARPLATRSFEGLSPGESVSADFSLNLNRTGSFAERVREALGTGVGDVETAVVVRTNVSGTVAGDEVRNATAYRLPLTAEGSVVRVDDPGTIERPHERVTSRTVPATVGPLRAYGGPLLFLLAAGALIGLIVARRTGRLAPTERERATLDHRRTRSEFDEWITRGRVPEDALVGGRIAVESLRGLVDVAIDTDERVIEDRERGGYVVVHDGLHYVYEPPAAATDADRPGVGGGGGAMANGEPPADEAPAAGGEGSRDGDGPNPDPDGDAGRSL